MSQNINLELWADNQFESLWGLNDICKRAQNSEWIVKFCFIQGFIPKAVISKEKITVTITGFGGYRFWKHLPKSMDKILSEGKVDQILYRRDMDLMLYANEDSSATMTGNQAQQRAERMVAFAKAKVPFTYLLPAFAVKASDQGIRTPNLWVPITALNLISAYKIPVSIFYFGSEEAPDNKRAGNGSELLGSMLWGTILRHLKMENEASKILKLQIEYMINIVNSRHSELFHDLPDWDKRKIPIWVDAYSNLASGIGEPEDYELPFNWNKPISQLKLPKIEYEDAFYIGLPFAKAIAIDLNEKRAYFPITGGSRGRPFKNKALISNIAIQKNQHKKGLPFIPVQYNDFTELIRRDGTTSNGNVSPSVLKKGLIRYERFADLKCSIENSIPRLKNKISYEHDDKPAILFIANNLVSTFLRDPYAGMLASYAVANGSLDKRQNTIILLWTPWQTPMLTIKWTKDGITPLNNKTSRSWVNHADFTIFNGDILIINKGGKLIGI